jgi:tyrosine-protein kinase Etk/Wzc
VQVEAKQGNALLKNLTSFRSDLSPDVAPELLLLKSRMILGQTVDRLGLTYEVNRRLFPVIGAFWEHVQGRNPAEITIGALNIPFWKGIHKRFYSLFSSKGDIVLRDKRLRQKALWEKRCLKRVSSGDIPQCGTGNPVYPQHRYQA